VAESNDWDVHVTGLLDGLVISSWVADNDKSWLQEFLGVLIGKGTWGPLSTEVVSSGVGSELEDSSLGVGSAGDNEDILWVLNGSNDSSSKHELLPGLTNVEVVDSLLVSGVTVVLHLLRATVGTNVRSSSEHESEIFISSVGVWEVGLAHF
jgi:hypothetical protein